MSSIVYVSIFMLFVCRNQDSQRKTSFGVGGASTWRTACTNIDSYTLPDEHNFVYPTTCRFGAVVTRRTCNAKIACSIQAIGILNSTG
jgi:hypothetical protein